MPSNDDISLILAKAKLNGMLPDVRDEEVDSLRGYAANLFKDDVAIRNGSGVFVPNDWGSIWFPKRNSRTAKVAIVGDSIGQMFDASTLAKSWAGLLKAKLQTKYGDGGSGFVGVANSSKYQSYGDNSMYPVVATGSWSIAAVTGTPGITCLLSSVVGDRLNWTGLQGTSISLYYLVNTTNGSFTYSIDGAATVTVNTAGAIGIGKTTVAVSPGAHTVEIIYSAGNAIGIAGCSAENSSGITVNNFSLAAKTSGDYVKANTFSPMADWNGGKNYPCDLLIYELGVNDAGAVAPNFATTADAYIDNVDSFITLIKNNATQVGATDVLLVLPDIGTWQSGSGPKWYSMLLKLRGYAEIRGYALVTMSALLKNSRDYGLAVSYFGSGNSTPGVVGTDFVHPSDIGHAFIYDTISSIV